MPIAESQLETWSHPGAGPGSRDTYDSVRTALESPKAVYKDKDYEVFLQGSYGNDTNIYGESDVDTVIRLGSIWRIQLELTRPKSNKTPTTEVMVRQLTRSTILRRVSFCV